MLKRLIPLLAALALPAMAADCPSTLKFVKRKLNSEETVNLCQAYQGKTLLIVNTASYCGFTPQFDGLEALYSQYKDKGLVVLGFPSDDFFQEADDEKTTAEVCFTKYKVNFPMFEKLHVRGDDADPLYRILASQADDSAPKWNFYKYLVGKDGKVIELFSSRTKPDSEELRKAIERAL
ncbi:glutathione peroxidase [Gallaecimonas xiamenensis]|uniref:Glutathione peroxidase n=1 Tax=Gallaecimonas xiamenensis 3-C-1 TaxID=745411 RepID=K2J163_9GAMM|nr:glutathione peroxidase [Gallaecimonas xiamenensis]EKE76646.1 glutathione peroxidase [Gallaecimonas xiamenensis 3-C-1]